MTLWLRNTSGKKDAVLTLAVATVVVVLLKVLAAGISVTIAAKTYALGSMPDGGVIASLLTPTLGAYVARRHTDANAPKKDPP